MSTRAVDSKEGGDAHSQNDLAGLAPKHVDQKAPRFQKFVFRHGGNTPIDFGYLVIDEATGRCVYRFWYDGVVDIPPYCKVTAAGNRDRLIAEYRSVNKTVAAYDGKRFWVAVFPEVRNNERQAARVRVFRSMSQVLADWRTNLLLTVEDSPQRMSLHWHDSAPVHQLMNLVSCKGFRRNDLRHALLTSSSSTNYKVSGSRFQVRSGPQNKGACIWSFDIELGSSGAFFENIFVEGPSWLGHWPFPTSEVYTITLDRTASFDEASFAKLVSFHSYTNKKTVVERIK